MNYEQLRKNILQQAAKQNIPVHGEFELTSNCNLNCLMCYVNEGVFQPGLSTEEWKNIFQAAVKNGLLFALLTGGEVFLRPDFIELYNYLYDLGVKITIYTNGTLINDEIIATLIKRPPEFLAITLYGSNNETYYQVTGKLNCFDKVDQNIDKLLKNKINLGLRTVPIRIIYEEIDEIIKYVKSKNISMGYYLYVGPKRGIPNYDLNYRLTPHELIDYQNKLINAFGYKIDFRNSDDGFTCSALRSAYFVTWQGVMQPCAMLNYPSMKISGDFLETWEYLNDKVKQVPKCQACFSCKYKKDCLQCMAKLYLEGGFDQCSDYLKEIAKLRYEVRNGKV